MHLLRRDGVLVGLPELFNHSGVTSQIFLAGDEDDGETKTEVCDF